MKLIVNSDDYGYTQGICEGILFGNRHGIITSTTVLINSHMEQSYIEAVKSMGVGLHLNLTLGSPVTGLSSLMDENGVFLPLEDNLENPDLEKELWAQVEKFIEIFGQNPDHLDSHHGLHRYPQIKTMVLQIMEKYHLRARELSEVVFCREFFGENVSVEKFIALLERYQHYDVVEVMCHAGYCDMELEMKSSYTAGRVKELSVLVHPEVLEYIMKNRIECITYGDLK